MIKPRQPSASGLMIRSLLFNLGLWGSIGIFVPMVLLATPFPFAWRSRLARTWAAVNLWWLRVTCRLSYHVEGLENIPEQPGIVMAKHQSAWETITLQTLFSPQVWVLKRELLRLPVFGWGLASMRPIAIDRSAGRAAVQQVVDQGIQRLKDGLWVIIFPEGTRTAPGHRGKYRIGGAILAEQSGYPVVPVAHNAGEFWSRKAFSKYPGVIQVVIGPPIPSKGRSATEIIREVEDWIEQNVTRISTHSPAKPAEILTEEA